MAHSTLSYADDSAMTQNAGQNEQAAARRSQAPVFVLGCPRSGTTVLYHMLLSAGGFAVYRAESQVFTLLSPRFGGLRSVSSRKEWLRTWEKSKLFRASGLDFHTVRDKLLKDCRNPGDCLQTFMNEIARVQGVERWADCTPDHLLYIREIKRQIPNALVVHIIRDGRDVALSYARQGWSHPLPWDRRQQLGVAALYWAWVVGQGRKNGRDLGEDYIEIRYEDLVGNPREVLNQLSAFIDQDLDYEHILKVGIGSVSSPNTSFGQDAGGNFNPVGRWKTKLPAPQLAMLESVIGDRLQELGYGLSQDLNIRVRARYMRLVYPQLFATKLWLKDHTPLGRFTDTGPMEISD